MSIGSRLSVAAVVCISSLFFCVSLPAFAQDRCAAFGPNFTAVEGSHHCVRIGGHVRVEFSSPVEDLHFMSNHFGASATSAALRNDSLGADTDFAEPQHMRVDTLDESYR